MVLPAGGGEGCDILPMRDGRPRGWWAQVPVDRLWGGGLVEPPRKAGHMEEGSGVLLLTTGLEFGLWVASPMRLQTQLQGCTEGPNKTLVVQLSPACPKEVPFQGCRLGSKNSLK